MPDPVLQVKMLGAGGGLRTPHYPGDVGYDLVVAQDMTLASGAHTDVPAGVAIKLPPDVWGLITGRSSTLRKLGVLVNQGVIDGGYTGPLFVSAWNLTSSEVNLAEGDRIGQLILLPNLATETRVEMVGDLGPTVRGEKAFGSSGR